MIIRNGLCTAFWLQESEEHMPLSKESLAMMMGPGNGGGGIRIMEGGEGNAPAGGGDDGDAAVDEDYELACRLMVRDDMG